MKGFQYLIFFSLLLFSAAAFGQGKALKKADALYKLNKYSEAIPHYESAIAKKKSLSAKTKLAYCYRMTNKMDKAVKLYAEIVPEERATVISNFYYAESLMGIEKYEEAQIWFKKYLEERPDDKQAKALLKACKEVKFIKPYFQGIKVKRFTQNSDTDDSAPVLLKNGIVFCSDRNQGAKLLKKKSGWTGRDFLSVYFSPQNIDETFEPAKSFSNKINEINKNTGPVTFNRDETQIIFTQNSSVANNRDQYPMQLYIAESVDGSKWKNKEAIPFCSPNYNFMHPALSPDGQRLFFISDKKGGEGGTDIFMAERTDRGWSRPKNIGATVNTSSNEAFPFVHEDGKLYFSSKGHVGYGGFDIYFTEQQADGSWAQPVNVGKPINSSSDDISIAIRPDNKSGAFSSSRKKGDDDIYLFKTTGGSVDAPYSITLTDDEEPAPSVNPKTEVPQTKPEDIASETASEVENKVADQKTELKSTINTEIVDHSTSKGPNSNLSTDITPDDNEPSTINAPQEVAESEPPANNGFSYDIQPADKKEVVNEVKENIPASTDVKTPPMPDHRVNTSETGTAIANQPADKKEVVNEVKENIPVSTDVKTPPMPDHRVNTSETGTAIANQPADSSVESRIEYVQQQAKVRTQPQKTTPIAKTDTPSASDLEHTKETATAQYDVKTKSTPPSTAVVPNNEELNNQSETFLENSAEKVKVSTPAIESTEQITPESNVFELEKSSPLPENPETSNSVSETPTLSEPITEITNSNNTPTNTPLEDNPSNETTPTDNNSPITEGKRINTAPTMFEGTVPAENSNAPLSSSRNPTLASAPLTVQNYIDLGYALSGDRSSVGQTFKLPNISYPFDAFDYRVTKAIETELNKLAEILKENPQLKIEIGGHTSSYGEDRVNLEISRERAKSAVKYLIKQGVSSNRMVSRGYGETQPVNQCINGVLCSRAEHLENQRLEIKVLDR